MRMPGAFFLLVLCGASRPVQASAPINLFRPDTGQKTTFVHRSVSDGKVLDTASYWITSLSGDTATYGFIFLQGRGTGVRTLAWSSGRLTAPFLLKSRTLDTNGIHAQRKTFPADYSRRTSGNPIRYGYTLQHVVEGFLFDTLLVSCSYNADADESDNCDFITPSGVLVYSSMEGSMLPPSGTRFLPDAETLTAMGGRQIANRIMRILRRKPVPASGLMEGFDIRRRWIEAAPAAAILPAPWR